MTKKGTLILWLVVIAILVVGGLVTYTLISKKRGIEASTYYPYTQEPSQPSQTGTQIPKTSSCKVWWFAPQAGSTIQTKVNQSQTALGAYSKKTCVNLAVYFKDVENFSGSYTTGDTKDPDTGKLELTYSAVKLPTTGTQSVYLVGDDGSQLKVASTFAVQVLK